MTTRCRTRSARVFTLITFLAVACHLAIAPRASARWGGGGFGGGRFGGGGFGGSHSGGGGFRGFGGDGFGGGSFGHNSSGGSSSWSHSSSSWQQHGQGYNTHHSNEMAEQQSRYNEANTLQENREKTEKSMHNSTMNTINNNVGQTNWNGGGGGYHGPYGDCCSDGGSSTGVALGAAALGTVGGMAVGSMIANENKPATTVVENYPAYGYQPAPYGTAALGTTVYSLPPGAMATTINGSTYFTENGVYYKPFYSGSQVVYVVSQP